jgi:hypothetical protein
MIPVEIMPTIPNLTSSVDIIVFKRENDIPYKSGE